MIEPGFYLGDCMDYLRDMPDKCIDLAIVDPPYGDALQMGGGVAEIRRSVRSVQEADTDRERTAATRTGHGVVRTGGRTNRYEKTKKLSRGTLRRNKIILSICFASHGIRLYGAEITLLCRLQDVF